MTGNVYRYLHTADHVVLYRCLRTTLNRYGIGDRVAAYSTAKNFATVVLTALDLKHVGAHTFGPTVPTCL